MIYTMPKNFYEQSHLTLTMQSATEGNVSTKIIKRLMHAIGIDVFYPIKFEFIPEDVLNNKNIKKVDLNKVFISKDIALNPVIHGYNEVCNEVIEKSIIVKILEQDGILVDENLTGLQIRIENGAVEDFIFGLDDSPELKSKYDIQSTYSNVTPDIDILEKFVDIILKELFDERDADYIENTIVHLIDLGITPDLLNWVGIDEQKIRRCVEKHKSIH